VAAVASVTGVISVMVFPSGLGKPASHI